MELTQVKHEIETLAEKYRDEFEAVSAYIFAHPELAYHEMLAQDQLCGLLEKHGFKVSLEFSKKQYFQQGSRLSGDRICGRIPERKARNDLCLYVRVRRSS